MKKKQLKKPLQTLLKEFDSAENGRWGGRRKRLK